MLIYIGTTGNFEVVIKSTNEKIHSKTIGKCTTKKEVDDIIEKIQKHFDSK